MRKRAGSFQGLPKMRTPTSSASRVLPISHVTDSALLGIRSILLRYSTLGLSCDSMTTREFLETSLIRCC